MQFIIEALNTFCKDSISFHQMIDELCILYFLFFLTVNHNKIYFPYMFQLICTIAMLKFIKIYQLRVRFQKAYVQEI